MAGENYIMKRVIIFYLHLILLDHLKKRKVRWAGIVARMFETTIAHSTSREERGNIAVSGIFSDFRSTELGAASTYFAFLTHKQLLNFNSYGLEKQAMKLGFRLRSILGHCSKIF